MAGSDDEVTPAGWYRQPDDPDLLRWWDGDDWTDDTMPVPETAGRRSRAAGTRKAPGGAGADGRATTTRTPRRTEPAAPRRTRRDAMAEAEAELHAEAPTPTDTGPVEIELERDPSPRPIDAPAAPEPDGERPAAREPDEEGEPEAAPASVRRRRATAPDGGPGYVRTTPETVRVLADPVGPPEDRTGPRAPAPRPRSRTRPPAGPGEPPPRVQRPSRPRPPAPEHRPAAAPPSPTAALPRTPARPAAQRPAAQRPAAKAPAAQRPADRDRRPERRPEADGDGHRPSRMAAGPSPAAASTMLRIIVRAGLLAGVLGLGWLGYVQVRDAGPGEAATLSADPPGVTVDPDAPRLDQIILTLADLPRGWSSQARNPSNGDLCEGRVPESVIEPTASQSAAFTFGDSGAVIGNTVHEFGNDDSAGAYLDLAARVLDSCREQTVDGATTRLVPLDFPGFGHDSFAAEITGEGSNGSLHGAIVYVRHDNRVASVVSISLDDDELNTELVEHLVDLVTRRMGSEPQISSEIPAG